MRVTQNIAPEAAMATEPESMAAVKLALKSVTLIGDHMQLQVRLHVCMYNNIL